MQTEIIIHGGESWESEAEYLAFLRDTYWIEPYTSKTPKWKDALCQSLDAFGHVVYQPQFPCKQNAKYSEWKIVGERLLQTIDSSFPIRFLGHSLGGNFLLKFLGEGDLSPYTIQSIHLVAACYQVGSFSEPTPSEWHQLASLAQNTPIHIWHAEDDQVVPIEHAQYIHTKIPNAQLHQLPSGGHFSGVTFPELEAAFASESLGLSL